MAQIVSISCDVPQPRAGQSFRLTVELDQNAEQVQTVVIEKQRIVLNFSGSPELRPTGAHYFELDPQPIKIAAGTKRGTSEPIAVKKDAQAATGEVPVSFPEQLLFTAFGAPMLPAPPVLRSVVVLVLSAV